MDDSTDLCLVSTERMIAGFVFSPQKDTGGIGLVDRRQSEVTDSLKFIGLILDNILNNPDDEKYRRINVDKAIIKKEIVSKNFALYFLMNACKFKLDKRLENQEFSVGTKKLVEFQARKEVIAKRVIENDSSVLENQLKQFLVFDKNSDYLVSPRTWIEDQLSSMPWAKYTELLKFARLKQRGEDVFAGFMKKETIHDLKRFIHCLEPGKSGIGATYLDSNGKTMDVNHLDEDSTIVESKLLNQKFRISVPMDEKDLVADNTEEKRRIEDEEQRRLMDNRALATKVAKDVEKQTRIEERTKALLQFNEDRNKVNSRGSGGVNKKI